MVANPTPLSLRRRLPFQNVVPDHEVIEIGFHEVVDGFLRRFHDWFAGIIKRGIQYERNSGHAMKSLE